MKIGIDSIQFYIPEKRIAISTIIEARKKESLELFEILSRAQINTQQEYMRISHLWQDSVCLATQATLALLEDPHIQNTLSSLRYVISATETPVDAAKPISAYALGILRKLYPQLPSKLVSYQTKHACAGGTISLIQAASMIQSSLNHDATAIVTTTDIAHYKSHTNAEITQGAGAISFYVSQNPRLLELNIQNIGYSSADVDDFFRPLHSRTAVVKGKYSMKCYVESTFDALEDFAQQKGKSVLEIIQEHEYLVFHAPFKTMPTIALTHILKKHLHLDHNIVQAIVEEKQLLSTAEIITHIGNTYTSSTYYSLGHLLETQLQKIGDKIIGKKILFISYGAGSTSVVMEGTVAEQAPQVIRDWNLQEQLNSYSELSMEEYDTWCNTYVQASETINKDLSTRKNETTVFLKEIRDDFYRIYDIT